LEIKVIFQDLTPPPLGLANDCSAICHKITTLDRAKLTDRIGQLPKELLVSIEKALVAAVDIRL
jgi:mRNA-degrading endonuclease toxin of MazEF toxin-antitoxin module